MYNALNEQQLFQEIDYRRERIQRRARTQPHTPEEPKVRRWGRRTA